MNASNIRPAQPFDVAAMVELSERKRTEYQAYQPIFWRKAANSRKAQTLYFEELLRRDNILALVHESDGRIDAFVIAALVPAPPVYDPGGLTCMIDDFCARGKRLGGGRQGAAGARGGACRRTRRGTDGYRVRPSGSIETGDARPMAAIVPGGFSIASEWYVKAISPSQPPEAA